MSRYIIEERLNYLSVLSIEHSYYKIIFHLKNVVRECAGNPMTWEVKARGKDVQGHPRLHSEFKTTLG